MAENSILWWSAGLWTAVSLWMLDAIILEGRRPVTRWAWMIPVSIVGGTVVLTILAVRSL